MKAHVGDRLVVRGHHVGDGERTGEIVEIRTPDGSPPYVVKWAPGGETGVVFPGTDARVLPAGKS